MSHVLNDTTSEKQYVLKLIEDTNQLYNVHLRQYASWKWINLQLNLFDITLISRIVIFIKEFRITLLISGLAILVYSFSLIIIGFYNKG